MLKKFLGASNALQKPSPFFSPILKQTKRIEPIIKMREQLTFCPTLSQLYGLLCVKSARYGYSIQEIINSSKRDEQFKRVRNVTVGIAAIARSQSDYVCRLLMGSSTWLIFTYHYLYPNLKPCFGPKSSTPYYFWRRKRGAILSQSGS